MYHAHLSQWNANTTKLELSIYTRKDIISWIVKGFIYAIEQQLSVIDIGEEYYKHKSKKRDK